MFMSVDLPAPFSPRSAWISGSPTTRSTPCSAVKSPKRFTMPRISTNGAVASVTVPRAPGNLGASPRDGSRLVEFARRGKAAPRSCVSLYLVRLPVRGRWARAAHEAGDGEDREDVGERPEQLHRHPHVADRRALERGRERVAAGEDEPARERADRRPAPEDHRREADEATTAGHAVGEGVRDADRHVRPAQPRDPPPRHT